MVSMSIYLSGVVTGIVLVFIYLLYVSKKMLNSSKKKLEKLNSIQERLLKIKEISELQFQLLGNVEGPQKNAMDGKYKNGLNGEIKRLEEEKNVIMQSIIDDGFDPTMTIMMEDGTVSEMKLSEFMGQTMPVEKPVVKQKPTFTVYKGGKFDNDDDGGITH